MAKRLRSVGAGRAIGAVAVAILFAGGCAASHEMVSTPSTPGMESGHDLLKRRCAGCHAVPDPRRFTREKWLASLTRMERKVRLTAANWDSLAALAANDTSGTSMGTARDTSGASLGRNHP